MTQGQFFEGPPRVLEERQSQKLTPSGGSAVRAATSVGATFHVVIMGVAGCGKSAVGRRVAAALDLPLIEGDDFHPPSNKAKMQAGTALNDDDRAGWLQRLAEELAARPGGAVLTCSALKRRYREVLRDVLRSAFPAADSTSHTIEPKLKFIYLAITPEESLRRVAKRAGHFYPPSLVTSQFEALEDPTGEPGVWVVDGTTPKAEVDAQAIAWLTGETLAPVPR